MEPSRRRMLRLVLSRAGMAASGIGLLAAAAVLPTSPEAQAESEAAVFPIDTVLRVANTDGQPVYLRAGPSVNQSTVARVEPDETLTVVGAAQSDGSASWVPVRTAALQIGWISAEYVAVLTPPSPVLAVASPEPAVADATPEETPPLLASSPEPLTAVQATATPEPAKPVEVEAKLKFPEAKGRHQEITVWVTREGAPIQGAVVTVQTEHDEDEPHRELEPTNLEGRTRREFAIGKEKGSIELLVLAVAPDGGTGKTTVSYFRR